MFKPEESLNDREAKVAWFLPSRMAHADWKERREYKRTQAKRGKDAYLISTKKIFAGGKTWAPSEVRYVLDQFEGAAVANVREIALRKTQTKYKTYLDGAVGFSAEVDWQDHVVSSAEEAKLERALQEAQRDVRTMQARRVALQDPNDAADPEEDEGMAGDIVSQQARERSARQRRRAGAGAQDAELKQARDNLEGAMADLTEAQENLRAYRWKSVLVHYVRFHSQWILGKDVYAKVLHEKGFREAKDRPEMTWSEVRRVIMSSFTRKEDNIELLENLLSARRTDALAAWLARVQSTSARVMGSLQLDETAETKQLWVDIAWRQVTDQEITRVFNDRKPKDIGKMIETYQQKAEDGAVFPRFDPARARKQVARLLVRPSSTKPPGTPKGATKDHAHKEKGGNADPSKSGGGRTTGKGRGGRGQDKGPSAGGSRRGRDKSRITCYHCQKKGHTRRDCPDKDKPRVPRKDRPARSDRVPRATAPPPVPKKDDQQYPAEEEPKTGEAEVVIDFQAVREEDSCVAVHAVGCSWVNQARSMGLGAGFARYSVKDIEEQQRGDLYAPDCCKGALTKAGHVQALEMMSVETQGFGRGARV